MKIDGNKTYVFIGVWVLYRILINHGILPYYVDLETGLLAAAGFSLRHGIKKSESGDQK